jgi:hypothetical protein
MKLALLFAAPLVTAMMFQTNPPVPPMKMGLWEMTSTGTVNGTSMLLRLPGLGSRTLKSRSCITPDTFEQAWSSLKNCTRDNVVSGPKSFSYDLTCANGRSKIHFAMTFDTPEHGTYTMHSVSSSQTMDTTADATFISTDCGGIEPGKPKIMK